MIMVTALFVAAVGGLHPQGVCDSAQEGHRDYPLRIMFQLGHSLTLSPPPDSMRDEGAYPICALNGVCGRKGPKRENWRDVHD